MSSVSSTSNQPTVHVPSSVPSTEAKKQCVMSAGAKRALAISAIVFAILAVTAGLTALAFAFPPVVCPILFVGTLVLIPTLLFTKAVENMAASAGKIGK